MRKHGLDLQAYLSLRGESENAFAKRSGVPRSIVNRVARGGGCHSSSARKIIVATRAEPTHDGRTVTIDGFGDDQDRATQGEAA